MPCILPAKVYHSQHHLANAVQQIILPGPKKRCSKPCASGHEGNWVSEVEISLSPLPQVLMWKAEFSNFLFLFAAIERAILDVGAQQLEVMWLMMPQSDKGGNGKNPADFSECWIKHLLNYLNTSKISLSPFHVLIIGIMSCPLFLQKGNHSLLFHPLVLQNIGRTIYFGTRSHMASFSLKGVLHSFELCSSVDRTDEPNVNGANGAVFNAQLTRSTPWWIKNKAGIREDPMEVEISCLGVCDSWNILISQQTLFFHVRSNHLQQKTEAEEFEREESMFDSEWFSKNNSPNPFDFNQLWVAFWTIWTERAFLFFLFSLLQDGLVNRAKVQVQ